MEKKCKDCEFFTDAGTCRISAQSKREYPGYFADACDHFEAIGAVKLEPLKPKPEPGTKVCKACGRELPLEAFVKHWRGNYIGYCKECWSNKMREHCRKGGAEAAKRGTSGRPPKKDKSDPKPKAEETKHPRLRVLKPKAQPAPRPLRREEIATAPLDALLAELTRRGYGVTLQTK